MIVEFRWDKKDITPSNAKYVKFILEDVMKQADIPKEDISASYDALKWLLLCEDTTDAGERK